MQPSQAQANPPQQAQAYQGQAQQAYPGPGQGQAYPGQAQGYPGQGQPHAYPGQVPPPPGPVQQPGGSAWELDVSGQVNPAQVQQQVHQRAGVAPQAGGGGTLFTEPVLVVNQKTKLVELNNEYTVFNQHGQQIGTVAQVGQSALKKAVRFLSSYDQFMTHKLEVRDNAGTTMLRLTRPAKLMKSRVIVEAANGAQIGEIKQQNAIGKINFALLSGGAEVGQIRAENWRAWNFAIVDHTGMEVARITKTFEGLMKTMFTTADNYVIQIHRQLADPLLTLVVASALTVDTALKQDARGFG